MNDCFPNDPADYANRLLVEQSRYRDDEHVHSLPGIFHYWSNRHIRPKLEAVGFKSLDQMFRNYLREQIEREDASPRRFASLGAGNCDLDIDLASDLRKHGRADFTIDRVDLNPAMFARGRALTAEQTVRRPP